MSNLGRDWDKQSVARGRKISRYRVNQKKETSKPLLIKVSFDNKDPTDLIVEGVLKQTKRLKIYKFKKVFFNFYQKAVISL